MKMENTWCLLILVVNSIYLFCHSDTNISTLIPTEIKPSLYGLSRSVILDLRPSSTRYHFPKPQQEHSRTQYHQCFNENLFPGIIKKWFYQHLSFSWVHSHRGPVLQWHHDTLSVQDPLGHIAQAQLLMCLLGRVITGRWDKAVSPPSHFTM